MHRIVGGQKDTDSDSVSYPNASACSLEIIGQARLPSTLCSRCLPLDVDSYPPGPCGGYL